MGAFGRMLIRHFGGDIDVYNGDKSLKNKYKIKWVSCHKALWKSTYKGWAFNLNLNYKIVDEDKQFYHIIDNKNQRFQFAKTDEDKQFYFFDKYFKLC